MFKILDWIKCNWYILEMEIQLDENTPNWLRWCFSFFEFKHSKTKNLPILFYSFYKLTNEIRTIVVKLLIKM